MWQAHTRVLAFRVCVTQAAPGLVALCVLSVFTTNGTAIVFIWLKRFLTKKRKDELERKGSGRSAGGVVRGPVL